MLPAVYMLPDFVICWNAWLDTIPAQPASQRAVQLQLTCMFLQWC